MMSMAAAGAYRLQPTTRIRTSNDASSTKQRHVSPGAPLFFAQSGRPRLLSAGCSKKKELDYNNPSL